MMLTPSVHLRAFAIADYAAACDLWSSVEGMGLNEADSEEAIAAFLARNPEFSAVALDSEGRIIGTILCGHNGRAGAIYHLAVAVEHRKRGLGKRLVEYAISKLADANVPRCNIFVYNENRRGNEFWLKNGWVDPSTWRVLQRRVKWEA